VSSRELRSDRQALLAKQRAIAATLGSEWFPLRDRLEADVLAGARAYEGDRIDPAARARAYRSAPGLYLRTRVADAGTVEAIRSVAADAKRDAFAACFLREPNERGMRGEIDAGAFSDQPWNLGQAYAATRILTEGWVRDVNEADEAMRLRVFTEQYDKAVRDEIPVAIDVVKRAQFFLLVLDEDVPEAAAVADGGAIDEAALQLVEHPARVYLYDLRTQREIVRVRRSAQWQVIPAGERQVTDPETVDAMKRQANNCALASSVDTAIGLSALADAGGPR
jgi:hypothetical protein